MGHTSRCSLSRGGYLSVAAVAYRGPITDGAQDRDHKSEVESGQELISLGSESLSGMAGAAAGAFLGPVGALAGGLGVPALNRVLGWAGREIQRRRLSSNEELRIGGALAVALARIGERQADGEKPRDDGLFDPETDPRGLLEGTLLSAARSYEQQKVPFIGAFYASFVFEEELSVTTAHFLLAQLDRLTYHQLCALAYFADSNNDEERMRVQVKAEEEGDRTPTMLVAELAEIANQGLLGFKQEDGRVVNPMSTWGSSTISGKTLAGTAPTELGQTLVRMAELDKIPAGDQQQIIMELSGGGR